MWHTRTQTCAHAHTCMERSVYTDTTPGTRLVLALDDPGHDARAWGRARVGGRGAPVRGWRCSSRSRWRVGHEDREAGTAKPQHGLVGSRWEKGEARPAGAGGPCSAGPFVLGWGGQWPSEAPARSGVMQTQEQGHRVPSGPFKGTLDPSPGARWGAPERSCGTRSLSWTKCFGSGRRPFLGLSAPWEAWNSGGQGPRNTELTQVPRYGSLALLSPKSECSLEWRLWPGTFELGRHRPLCPCPWERASWLSVVPVPSPCPPAPPLGKQPGEQHLASQSQRLVAGIVNRRGWGRGGGQTGRLRAPGAACKLQAVGASGSLGGGARRAPHIPLQMCGGSGTHRASGPLVPRPLSTTHSRPRQWIRAHPTVLGPDPDPPRVCGSQRGLEETWARAGRLQPWPDARRTEGRRGRSRGRLCLTGSE